MLVTALLEGCTSTSAKVPKKDLRSKFEGYTLPSS